MLAAHALAFPGYGFIHLLFYQVTWAVALWGGSQGMIWPGVIAGIFTLAVHVICTERRKNLGLRLLIATVLGIALDSLLMASGLIVFPAVDQWPAYLPPLWMIILWPTFASLLDDILHWLVARLWLAIVAGVIAGPLAYVGGQAFGALQLSQPLSLSVVGIGVAWGLAMALFIVTWRKFGATS
jgi:hypothetical protein